MYLVGIYEKQEKYVDHYKEIPFKKWYEIPVINAKNTLLTRIHFYYTIFHQ